MKLFPKKHSENSNPFFSIVIPTYNRDKHLKQALKAILLQDYKNFEIVVSDNNSQDKTKDYVLGYKSRKIVYKRNKKNIGWIENLKQAIRMSRGEYLIFHGDDDFMVNKNTLRILRKIIYKRRWGVIRMSYVNRSRELNALFSFHNFRSEDVKFERKDKTAILEFLEKIDPFFLTGIVIKNEKNISNNFIRSELAPWIKILFKATMKKGAFYYSKPCFVANWSQHAAQPFFNIAYGKLRYENYFNWINEELGKENSKEFIVNRLNRYLSLLPAVKFHNGLRIFLQYAKRIVQLNRRFLSSYTFWFWFFLALFAPKFILKYARIQYIKSFISRSENNNFDLLRKNIKKIENESG